MSRVSPLGLSHDARSACEKAFGAKCFLKARDAVHVGMYRKRDRERGCVEGCKVTCICVYSEDIAREFRNFEVARKLAKIHGCTYIVR